MWRIIFLPHCAKRLRETSASRTPRSGFAHQAQPSPIQYLSNLVQQCDCLDGFREEGESVVLNPLVEDNISCVAADKEHLHIRRQGTNLVIGFSTVSFRHDRIQDEKIYV